MTIEDRDNTFHCRPCLVRGRAVVIAMRHRAYSLHRWGWLLRWIGAE